MTIVKSFKRDHAVRDRMGRPIGRIVLRDDSAYEEGEPVDVALLTVPVTEIAKIKALVLYLDGHPYRVPEDVPDARIIISMGRHRVNSFMLEPVNL